MSGPGSRDGVDATTEGEEGDGEAVDEDGGDDHESDDRLDCAGEDFLLGGGWGGGFGEGFGG